MITQAQVAALEERIRRVEATCKAWQAQGEEEKYLEAFDLIESLELQLIQRMQISSGPMESAALLKPWVRQ